MQHNLLASVLSYDAFMDVAWKGCWDCPIPLWAVLSHFAVLAVVLVIAARIQRRRREPYTTVGWLLVALTSLWAAAFTTVVPRWGILKSELQFDSYSRSFAWFIVCALDVVLLGVFIAARRLRSTSNDPAVEQTSKDRVGSRRSW